ncbi:MAG: 50S ribosomal protein L13 [bacterium]|nr:50S ribosomal protein L13 [bacterium]
MEHTIDAKGKTIGRVASAAALLLRGKNDPAYQPHLAPKNKVTIINAKSLKISDRKLTDKIYRRHTHYPGGEKFETLEQLLVKKGPSEALRRAVRGMLPANRLRPLMMKHLIIKD